MPKPEGFAWRPGERGHRLSELLFEIHPPAQFLSTVVVNNPDLIFVTVVVRHLFLFPKREAGSARVAAPQSHSSTQAFKQSRL